MPRLTGTPTPATRCMLHKRPEKQRGGVYGTAQLRASCLTDRQVASWVNTGRRRLPSRQFKPAAFARDGGTP